MMNSAVQVLAVAVAALAMQQYTRRRMTVVSKAKKAHAEAQAAARQSSTLTRHVMPETAAASGSENGTTGYIVEIEYCTGCRWMLRAAWMAQELLTTFQQDTTSQLRAVTLTPNSRQGGVFQVYLYTTDGSAERELLWSRKVVGRFPESKELKQIVRDAVCPDMGLGHSDKK